MFFKYKHYKPFTFLAIVISIIGVITYIYLLKEEENLLKIKYSQYVNHTNQFIKNLIEEKENATLVLAIALSKDERVQNFIKIKNSLELDYKNISNELKTNTKYKNVWIQIINLDGKSLYRSWTDIKSDLNFREDLKKTLDTKKISTSISIGHFDLTIKGRAPIYDKNDNLIGFIELITHFNSISEQLKDEKIDSLIIADKKYKNRILYPFSNTFIGDYYVSNKDLSENINQLINQNNISEYINKENYSIKNGYLTYTYTLSNEFDKNLGYILNFIKLEDIDTENIKAFKTQFINNIIILIFTLTFVFMLYIYFIESKNLKNSTHRLKKHIKILKTQQQYKQSILDSQTSIIVITNGKIIINSNKRLFEFFKDVRNLSEFKEKYTCICSVFIDMNDEMYIIDKDYNGKNWAEFILENSNKNFRVAMLNYKKDLKHFSISVSTININQNIIVTLTDITTEVEQMALNKEKDRLLYQQSKISAISDTLKNIAHHWRQPLSVISTIASGMKIEKELNILDDNRFNDLCDNIVKNTTKLSNTIDNFSNFFNKDDLLSSNFELVETIENTIKFLNSVFEKNQIKCIFEYDKNKIFNTSKSDFSQAILNIIDNSIYALINNQENEKLIFIEFKNNKLSIKDNANGIDKKILSKIFEPYFTTKHQAYGVGLGLYIVEEFFVKKLGYKIDVKNVTFEYESKNYIGTNFIIDFN